MLAGCNSRPTVVGTVNVDGEPLAKGSIRCVPIDDQGALAQGRGPGGGDTIMDGKYQIDKGSTAGRYQVEIQGTKHVPGKKMLDPIMSYGLIPAEVPVVQTTLIMEVAPGSNTKDFDLNGIVRTKAKAGP
jgi:hypothetical protein